MCGADCFVTQSIALICAFSIFLCSAVGNHQAPAAGFKVSEIFHVSQVRCRVQPSPTGEWCCLTCKVRSGHPSIHPYLHTYKVNVLFDLSSGCNDRVLYSMHLKTALLILHRTDSGQFLELNDRSSQTDWYRY